MKNTILKSLILLTFFSFLGVGCSTVDSCSETQAQADSDRIQELSDIYIADIFNDEKCQDFVDAVRQFVSDYRDCDNVDQESIEAIESSLSDLPCG